MPPLDETDSQLAAELKEKSAQKEQKEQGQEPTTEPTSEPVKTEEVKPEPKMYDEATVKALRAESAKYRIRAREAEAKNNEFLFGQNKQPDYPQAGQSTQQPQEFYDPRVDDIILNNKINEMKTDPDLSELFDEVDEEGLTFQEKLLEKAVELQWPIAELDALALKMTKEKLLGRVKQKGIDEAYKSMSSKAGASAERNVSSGAKVEESEVKDVEDALNRAKKEHGVTNLSELR